MPSGTSVRGRLPEIPAAERVLLGIALGAFLWTALRHWGYLLDDSFIALRYARNLVEGHGLVFNPGERVEGYTSLALVLVSALFLKLGIDPVSGVSVLSGAMAAWTLWMTARLERALMAPESAGARVPLSALLLLATSAFAYWALRAMETMLFTALLLAALSLALRESGTGRWRGSGLLFGLLALVRPEAPLLFGILTAALLLLERRSRGDWSSLGRHAGNALIVLAVVGMHGAWRSREYGELLPNTFYAKVTGGPGQLATGLRYLRDWSLAFPLFAATLAFPLLLLAPRMRAQLCRPALAIHLVVLGYVLYVVAVGADFMPFFRFFVPVMPLCAVLAAIAIRALPLPGRSSGPILAALLVAHGALGLLTEQPYRAFVAHRTALVGERVGDFLAAHLAPNDWIAVNTAGSLPYVSRLPTIDMLGLTDAQIARRPIYIVSEGWAGHRRGWGEYVLSRRPRVILWYNSAGLAEPHYLSDHELADDARFRFFYQLRAATLPPAGDSSRPTPIRRFLGFPFGSSPSRAGAIPDLGLRLAFHDAPLGWTTFFEGPLRIVTFELDARDAGLWEEGWRLRGDPGGLVELAASHWARQPSEPGDGAARAEVEALCEQARGAIAQGEIERAREMLAQATARNRAAHSPLVPHYVANLAVLTGELFAALAAQKEALRLDPERTLYRENLARLLAVPWSSFRERHAAGGEPRPPASAAP